MWLIIHIKAMEIFHLNLSLDRCIHTDSIYMIQYNVKQENVCTEFPHNAKDISNNSRYIFYPLSSTIYEWYKPLTKNETSNNSIFKSNESHWFNFSFISWIVVEWYAVFHVKLLCTYIALEHCRLCFGIVLWM